MLDHLSITQPPFDPESVTRRYAALLRNYGLGRTLGDAYAAEWVQGSFGRHGIRYEPADLDKSSIYVECLPLFAQGRVELLDLRPLVLQFRLLERRPRAGGKGDLVDHPPRAQDDAANAVAGALWLASKRPANAIVLSRQIVHPKSWSPMDCGRHIVQSAAVKREGPLHSPAQQIEFARGRVATQAGVVATYRVKVAAGEVNPKSLEREQRRLEVLERALAELQKGAA